jgi:hypothetical protein
VHTDNALELDAEKIDIHIESNFKYKALFITVDGKADIKITNVGIDLELGFGTTTANPSYDIAPVLTALKTGVTINPDDVQINLSGGLVAKIAGVLIPLIKSSLIPSIVTQVQDTIKSTITDTVDPFLVNTTLLIPYLAGVTVDYGQLKGGPTVTPDDVFQMALNASFYDVDHAPFAGSPAAFPLRSATGKDLQLYGTDYVVNSLFTSAW